MMKLTATCLPGLEPLLLQELKSVGITSFIVSSTSQSKSTSLVSRRNPHESRSQINEIVTAQRGTVGGVKFLATKQQLFQCHANLGTASAILFQCQDGNTHCNYNFRATGLAELRRKVAKMPIWKDLLLVVSTKDYLDPVGCIHKNSQRAETETRSNALPFVIRVTSSKSKLFHTKAIAQRVEQGILDALQLNSPHHTMASTTTSSENVDAAVHILVKIIRDQVLICLDTSSHGIPLHKRGKYHNK